MGDFRRISFLFLWVLFSAGCVTLPENGPSTMTLNPNHTANLMMNYVEKEKQFGKAIELGKQMTAQQPSFAPAWYWMGVAYYAQNEYDQAITALKRVAELKPQTAQLPSSYEFLGYSFFEKRDYPEALRWLKMALDQKPDSIGPYFTRALAYLFTGRYDEALSDAERVLATFHFAQRPNHVTNMMRVKAFSNVGLGKTETGLSVIGNLKEMNPAYDSWEDLALIYYASGDEGKLKEHFGKRGWLGVTCQNYSQESARGIQIQSLMKGSPAEKGGLLPGDLILQMNGKFTQDQNEFLKNIGNTTPGTRVGFKILRAKEEKELTLQVEAFPREQFQFESYFFIPPLMAKKRTYQSAEQAEKNGDYRKAFQLYLESSAKSGLDSDIRKRVIKLYGKIDPPPAIPEEARKRAVFGMTAAKEAKDPKGFDRAIEEYQKAIELAPWWADLYYNLAMVQEQRGNFRQAAETLKFYLAASPGDAQAPQIQNKIYELEYKAEKR